MARIPTYRRQNIPSTNTGMAPRSVSASRTQGELIGKALGEIGTTMKDWAEQMQDEKLDQEEADYRKNMQELKMQDLQQQQQEAPLRRWEPNIQPVQDFQPAQDEQSSRQDQQLSLGSILSSPGRSFYS